MRSAVLLIAVFALAYAGCVLIALSQAKHLKRVGGDTLKRARPSGKLRAAALALVAFAAAAAVLRDGASFGILLWITSLSVSAVAVAFTLAWRPAWLRPFLAATRML